MGLPVQHDVSGLWGIVQASGPSGKFCNAQARHKHCGQGAVRREWQALSNGCNTAHDACGAALREPLCECDSVLRFLPREGPLPAKRALIRTRTVALNVTELSTWPTRPRPSPPLRRPVPRADSRETAYTTAVGRQRGAAAGTAPA